MTTPAIPQKPINQAIYEAIQMACMTSVEFMPETQAIFDKRDELCKRIENKVSHEVAGKLQDVAMELACQFGDEMFKLGIALGRDPDKIFDLPNAGN